MQGSTQSFTLSSPDFQNGGPLPASCGYNGEGCHGENRAPTLTWNNPPQGTSSLALTMIDYDAPVTGGFHHWIVYNIPASTLTLQGNTAYSEGTTNRNTQAYTGPCPPPGQTHRYTFTLYALNIPQIQGEGLNYDSLMQAIQEHIIASTQLVGTYQRGEG